MKDRSTFVCRRLMMARKICQIKSKQAIKEVRTNGRDVVLIIQSFSKLMSPK